MIAERYWPEGVELSPLALHLLGILHATEGRPEEAEAAFLRAVEVEPEMVGSYFELGLVYADRGEYRRMVEALRQAVAVGASGVRAYLGERPLGDFIPAPAPGTPGRASEEAEGQPEAEHAHAWLAMTHLAEGRDSEATAILERFRRHGPDTPPLELAMLALAYLLQGMEVWADESGVGAVTVPGEGKSCGG